MEDDEGLIWIGPRLRVDPRRWRAQELGPSDGVSFRNFYIASRAKTRDGRLLFGSPEGLLVVDPKRVRAANSDIPIVATALRVEGHARLGAAVLPSIALSKSERSFTVDFAALDFSAPQRLVYRHRLDGLDEDWTVMGVAQHSLTYSRVPPGQYTLRVGVMSAQGQWNTRELRLPVTVLPALYQQAWFQTLAVVAVLAFLYVAYRLRVRQLRERERELEQLVQHRTGELAEKNEQLQQASLTDPLTGLRNRRYLEQTIEADLEIAARGGADRDLLIVMIDLDHFKSVNDQYGHAAGDAVLVQLADLLRRTFRTSDAIVRWGGEEFVVVVRFVDRIHAMDLSEKLRSAVASHRFALPDGSAIQRTCSIGFAAWPFSPAVPRALGWERVIDLADAALYIAKHASRNAWAGIALGNDDDPVHAVDVYRTDPETAVARGVIVLMASFSRVTTAP
jgi:diguanylate cyclase (GGDEF)-like protein